MVSHVLCALERGYQRRSVGVTQLEGATSEDVSLPTRRRNATPLRAWSHHLEVKAGGSASLSPV